MVTLDLFRWLVEHARDTEWQTCHAAENQYCPHCGGKDDSWTSQTEHHPGCAYVAMMEQAERVLKQLEENDARR
jgi:hypothetical protein